MVAVAGGLLGAASRGSLFSDSSNASRDIPIVQPAPTDDQTGSSGASGPSGGSSSSSTASDVSAALVNVTTTLSDGGEGAGTGMIISSSGYVLTNNHVIANSTSIRVEIGGDGSSHTAKVVGYDVADDVALIKIDDVSGLDTIPIGDPDDVQINDDVTVIGNALGRGGSPTVTPGTVVALNRQITATDADGSNAETLVNMIQVEADVQPGDSGGALVGDDGKVVGMTTAASVNGFRLQQTTTGVGFAIRIDKAVGIAEQIRNGDETDGVHVGGRALLGVSITDSGLFGGSSQDGAYVNDVAEDTPAADAGIQGGDTIVAIGDETIASSRDLQDVMNGYHPGDKVSVSWIDSSGDTRHATLQLVEGPPA
jgi:S1-C subfamily serine protease